MAINQVSRRRRRGNLQVRDSKVLDSGRFPHRLSLYNTPPNDEVSLEEFESSGYDRLRLLKAVEQARLCHPKRGPQYFKEIKKACDKYMPLGDSGARNAADVYEERRKDHLSHFVLRLAYCRSEELRRWFLQQEVELFRCRFENESINDFLNAIQNLKYDKMSDEEKRELESQLKDCGFNLSIETVRETAYYKLPFKRALELVRQRKVLLKGGMAYVPEQELLSIICSSFRQRLSLALTHACKALPALEEDERLDPILRTMSKNDLADEQQLQNRTGVVHPSDLDELSNTVMPLCMRNLHVNFKADHHLKHWGRLQYGLFLKGIGVMLEDAINYWRSEFTQKMAMDKFDREHVYTLRHMYGKEGKRTNYTPYSCVKIITGQAPGTGDHHGCPFKHFDGSHLVKELKSTKVPNPAIQEILKLVKDQHFQVACSRYFAYKIGPLPENVDVPLINHPNGYFTKAIELNNFKAGIVNAGASTVKSESLPINE
ncbi:hypothetical protein SARC_04505 [Sphaeroforma arctica JP610]|uniref:DNA primase large subunit n=1 Tax=Sphaeroforma arctica JP610 TaxID=667725 RepID=A0A0L0G302_9EUKA|nr:hypothetical protein SARC_04505 [Sphaeroforma arctica JP610]KNC83224.1 hypothetical protein SARC_04505 [Sphaeroforma arctica JP610]|eukprot:XP_014157126.1 hypothetical protein SARC_04505 [Sphaeroforma arctica JP610]